MFSAATPVKKVHTRASAAARRSHSRATSVLSQAQSRPASPSTSNATPGPSSRKSATKTEGLPAPSVEHGSAGNAFVEGGVLLQTESHVVSFFGAGLPTDIKQLLSTNGQSMPLHASFQVDILTFGIH